MKSTAVINSTRRIFANSKTGVLLSCFQSPASFHFLRSQICHWVSRLGIKPITHTKLLPNIMTVMFVPFKLI